MTIDRQALYDLIVAAAAEVGDVDLSTVDRDADLFDLGIDSLHFTTVLVEVEERLGDDIPAEAFDRFAELDRFTIDSILDALTGPASPSLPPLR